MIKESEYGRRLWRWLERSGFTDDPFALYEADQERPDLPFFFVDRPYLHDILGDPAHPQAALLMAGRGGGKTATREMVAYECTHARLRRRALPVRYYDFSPLLEQVHGDLTQLSARHHIRAIARATLKALAGDVPPTYFDLLGDRERALLMGYAAAFADPISNLKLDRIIPDEPVQLNWDALSPGETLESLAGLVTQLGQSSEDRYQALYVLVDRVDETAAGPEAAVPLLKPFVSEGPLLGMAHVALKFFLPIEVGEQLRFAVALRPDRLCVRTISWDKRSLRKMVQQRLLYYSDNRIARLEEICTSAAKIDAMERLIRACEGSPRTLLRFCRGLIHHHVARTDDALIDRIDLLDTRSDFAHQLEIERTETQLAPVATAPSPAVPTGPPESGLNLNAGGQVWVD